MTDRHFAFWPRRVPHSLTLPETNVYYNGANCRSRKELRHPSNNTALWL